MLDEWKENIIFSEEFNLLTENEPFLEYYDDPNVYYYYGLLNDIEFEYLNEWFLDAEETFAGYVSDFDIYSTQEPFIIFRDYVFYGIY